MSKNTVKIHQAQPLPSNRLLESIEENLRRGGHEVRFVGGCLRDFLMAQPIKDIDLATTARPEQMLALLGSLRVIPTGLDHGTVTVVDTQSGRSIEITSLRRDVITHGRRAQVCYGVEWHVDAKRRDFTFNALSMSFDGKVYDYVGGFEDVQKRHLRFVGHAQRRIEEDALRILRFFRFVTSHAHTYDTRDLQACFAHREKLKILSLERVWQECKQILAHPQGLKTWSCLGDHDVLKVFLPSFEKEQPCLQRLLRLEQQHGATSIAVRLAVMGIPASELQSRLRLSRSLKQQVEDCQSIREQDFNRSHLRRMAWSYNLDVLKDWLLTLLSCQPPQDWGYAQGSALLETLQAEGPGLFPLAGKDLIGHGCKEGRELGDLLKKLQDWWCNQDQLPDRESTLRQLKRMTADRRAHR